MYLRHQTITIFDSISQVGIEQSVFTDLQRWVDEDGDGPDIEAKSALHYVICEVRLLLT